MSVVRKYENFLDLRREETSNFLWVARRWDPVIAFNQGRKRPTPQFHKDAVVNSPKIQELLEQISAKGNISKNELERQVREILDEIGYEKKLKIIRWLGLMLTKICLTVLSGIYVSIEQVQEIKHQMGKCPLIFVPTHRSYGDFIMMSYVAFQYDIEIPAIAAGMDFQGMWGMGTILRDTGAFFMRRSYNNDSLYWTTFRQYVYQLVSKGDLPIEFFIEGTRSRSNKSLSPKYGLLTMCLKPFFFSEVPDIHFVPISVCYDRILEESLFAFELLGLPKPKESTSGFFKSMKILKENFGNIYVHMDKPISVKEYFGDKLDRSVHNLGALHHQEVTEDEKKLLPPLAYEILNRQQKTSILTIFNLVALILNHNLMQHNEISTKTLVQEVTLIGNVLKLLGGYVHTTNIKEGVNECFVTHKNLIKSNRNGKITLVRNAVNQGDVNPKKLKGHLLSNDTMTYSVPFVMLQIYVNPVLHYLVDINIILVILGSGSMRRDELFENFQFMRSLFAREFITLAPKDQTIFDTALNNALNLNLIKVIDDSYVLEINDNLQKLIINTFLTFYTSFYCIMVVLGKLPEVTDEKSILANTQKIIENVMSDKKEFIHPYSLNLDTLGNCLASLVDAKVAQKNKKNNTFVYEVDKRKLFGIKEHFGKFFSRNDIDKYCVINENLQNKL